MPMQGATNSTLALHLHKVCSMNTYSCCLVAGFHIEIALLSQYAVFSSRIGSHNYETHTGDEGHETLQTQRTDAGNCGGRL